MRSVAWRATAVGALACLLLAVAGCGGSSEPAGASVTIESEPSGASVTIKSEARGITPITLKGLEPGNVTVMLKLDGYERTYEQVPLKAGENGTVTLAMKRMVGYLTVKSAPEGAEVVLSSGEVLGKTPLTNVPLPTGEYTYEVRHPDYLPSGKTFDVEENLPYEFHHALAPIQATLVVMSRPTGATIWVDDELKAEKTPARYKVAPGTYTVAVQRGGYLLSDQVVAIGPNEEYKVDIEMAPGEAPEGMLLVPAGPFLMGQNGGAPDESPQREVQVEAFYIDRYEVSNLEFQKVFPSHTFSEGQQSLPVAGVSFNQAAQYATNLGKRLPTEAEWEKAARGADGREFPWGNSFDKSLCNMEESGAGKPVQRGSFLLGASPSRCLDMAGNVYEWTSNWYEAYPGNTVITKDYGQVYRVLRGGSCLSQRFEVRCARRHFDRMDAARKDYGFRCVKDLPSVPERVESQ